MITKSTVLILGAGASKPYGYPLGEELTNNIITNLYGDVGNPSHYQSKYFNELFDFVSDRDFIIKFVSSLKNSELYSIDSFLEKRREFIEIGKIAIAQELLKYCNNCEPKDLNDHWYKRLWDKMASPLDHFPENKIAFLTFNYDMSLEYFLYQKLINTFGIDNEECTQLMRNIPIIHLHGKLSVDPWARSQQTHITNSEASKNIKIIHEDINLNTDKDFTQAFKLLNDAEKIYFLGFGYHEINLKRLNIKSLNCSNKIIRGSKFNLTDNERDQIKVVEPNIDFASFDHWKNVDFFRQCMLLN